MASLTLVIKVQNDFDHCDNINTFRFPKALEIMKGSPRTILLVFINALFSGTVYVSKCSENWNFYLPHMTHQLVFFFNEISTCGQSYS